jgi:hypothetical protein
MLGGVVCGVVLGGVRECDGRSCQDEVRNTCEMQ